tara:strand:- start:170 stop:466 length:297 start_codon:yes stop_codon:yes gene_type:complete
MEENSSKNSEQEISTDFKQKTQASSPQSEILELESQAAKEIDLNVLFPGEDKDLNDLFPEEEMRILLKKVEKNRKDIAQMHKRFQNELELTEEKTDHT